MLLTEYWGSNTLEKCSELRAATDRLCCASDKNPELMTLVLPALGEVEVVAELPKCERAFILKS